MIVLKKNLKKEKNSLTAVPACRSWHKPTLRSNFSGRRTCPAQWEFTKWSTLLLEAFWVLQMNLKDAKGKPHLNGVEFSSAAQSCLTLCDPMNCSTPGLPVHHQLPEFTQTDVHRVSNAIQPSHPLSSPSPPAPNPSQHQGLFQWVNSLHEVAKVLEFQLQHQSLQWTHRTDLL